MSFLKVSIPITTRRCLFAAIPKARMLSTTSARMVRPHQDHNPQSEAGKQQVLKEQSPKSNEEAQWREELASDSEAYVKSDRNEMDHSHHPIKELQKESAERLKAKK